MYIETLGGSRQFHNIGSLSATIYLMEFMQKTSILCTIAKSMQIIIWNVSNVFRDDLLSDLNVDLLKFPVSDKCIKVVPDEAVYKVLSKLKLINKLENDVKLKNNFNELDGHVVQSEKDCLENSKQKKIKCKNHTGTRIERYDIPNFKYADRSETYKNSKKFKSLQFTKKKRFMKAVSRGLPISHKCQKFIFADETLKIPLYCKKTNSNKNNRNSLNMKKNKIYCKTNLLKKENEEKYSTKKNLFSVISSNNQKVNITENIETNSNDSSVVFDEHSIPSLINMLKGISRLRKCKTITIKPPDAVLRHAADIWITNYKSKSNREKVFGNYDYIKYWNELLEPSYEEVSNYLTGDIVNKSISIKETLKIESTPINSLREYRNNIKFGNTNTVTNNRYDVKQNFPKINCEKNKYIQKNFLRGSEMEKSKLLNYKIDTITKSIEIKKRLGYNIFQCISELLSLKRQSKPTIVGKRVIQKNDRRNNFGLNKNILPIFKFEVDKYKIVNNYAVLILNHNIEGSYQINSNKYYIEKHDLTVNILNVYKKNYSYLSKILKNSIRELVLNQSSFTYLYHRIIESLNSSEQGEMMKLFVLQFINSILSLYQKKEEKKKLLYNKMKKSFNTKEMNLVKNQKANFLSKRKFSNQIYLEYMDTYIQGNQYGWKNQMKTASSPQTLVFADSDELNICQKEAILECTNCLCPIEVSLMNIGEYYTSRKHHSSSEFILNKQKTGQNIEEDESRDEINERLLILYRVINDHSPKETPIFPWPSNTTQLNKKVYSLFDSNKKHKNYKATSKLFDPHNVVVENSNEAANIPSDCSSSEFENTSETENLTDSLESNISSGESTDITKAEYREQLKYVMLGEDEDLFAQRPTDKYVNNVLNLDTKPDNEVKQNSEATYTNFLKSQGITPKTKDEYHYKNEEFHKKENPKKQASNIRINSNLQNKKQEKPEIIQDVNEEKNSTNFLGSLNKRPFPGKSIPSKRESVTPQRLLDARDSVLELLTDEQINSLIIELEKHSCKRLLCEICRFHEIKLCGGESERLKQIFTALLRLNLTRFPFKISGLAWQKETTNPRPDLAIVDNGGVIYKFSSSISKTNLDINVQNYEINQILLVSKAPLVDVRWHPRSDILVVSVCNGDMYIIDATNMSFLFLYRRNPASSLYGMVLSFSGTKILTVTGINMKVNSFDCVIGENREIIYLTEYLHPKIHLGKQRVEKSMYKKKPSFHPYSEFFIVPGCQCGHFYFCCGYGFKYISNMSFRFHGHTARCDLVATCPVMYRQETLDAYNDKSYDLSITAIASTDGRVTFWCLYSLSNEKDFQLSAKSHCLYEFINCCGPTCSPTSMEWSSCGGTLIMSNNDGSITLFTLSRSDISIEGGIVYPIASRYVRTVDEGISEVLG